MERLSQCKTQLQWDNVLCRSLDIIPNVSEETKTYFEVGSPLALAAARGHLAAVKLLLNHGADPNAGSGAAGTPLHRACEFGRLEIVRALLKAGADSNAVDGENENPLQCATFACNVRYLFSESVLDELASLLQPDDCTKVRQIG